jgi:CHAT domain-containing protein
MKKIRLTLLAFLAAIPAIGLYAMKNQQQSLQVIPPPSKPSKLPVSRLQPQVLKQFLDKQDINSAIKHVELGWKQQYEEYLQRKLPTNQVIEVKEISRILDKTYRQTGKKTALIYAVPTPKHLELILVTPGKAPIHKRITAAKRDILLSTVSKFRKNIVNNDSLPQNYLGDAKQLHEWVITPLESALKAQGINNLIFCLGSGLRTVPLAAIHDGKQFLIEKYSLGIIPAFNLLDYQASTSLNQTQVLAMGASKFQNQSALPAVPVEIDTIISNSWQGKSLLNQDFTLANLKAQRAIYPFGIVHLATHAEFSPGLVDQSYIQFWDKQVRLDELKSLELSNPPVQLLVLSACRTALGDSQAELGFAGLAVQSGAKAAIASLWSVSDGGTLALMSEFYPQLKTTSVKAEALRQTQIAMLKQQVSLKDNPAIRGGNVFPGEVPLDGRKLSHPYYWAGFTLIGNPW